MAGTSRKNNGNGNGVHESRLDGAFLAPPKPERPSRSEIRIPRPLLHQILTIAPHDVDDSVSATVEIMAFSACTACEDGGSPSACRDFPELYRAGWRGENMGILDLYYRIVVKD